MPDSRSTQIAALLEDARTLLAGLADDVPETDKNNQFLLAWLGIRVSQSLTLARELQETL